MPSDGQQRLPTVCVVCVSALGVLRLQLELRGLQGSHMGQQQLVVKTHTLQQILAILPYSCEALLAGTFPTVDHTGRAFGPKDGWRFAMAGKPIAGGWRGAFSSMRGDMPMHDAIHEWRTHRHNYLCNRCGACKHIQHLCYTNGSANAAWRETMVTHEQWLTPQRARLAIVQTPGWRLERSFWDFMHGLHLGIVQV
eukprot:8535574-Alexandrium_andersonii.AAC.1